ncbi:MULTISPECIES: hypothetical protein [Pseudomonas]|uniref:hypothetical protein n=1 Tax=Pseudomonas TaxID=286 RepID=UPI000C06E3AC|nr:MULTISPECIES: hypothetical protein [Pseudomonas]MCD5977413.1 hypothetical protein [Pseudomonas quasicaspiana]
MVSLQDVRHWIEGEIYSNLLEQLVQNPKLATNDKIVPDALLGYDIEDINAAGVTVKDLEEVASDKLFCQKYVLEKLKSIEGTENQQEGKHSEDEDDVLLETLPFYKNFLNIYLIELHLLKTKPEMLDSYLKKIRIPNAKQYAKQLRSVYESIR